MDSLSWGPECIHPRYSPRDLSEECRHCKPLSSSLYRRYVSRPSSLPSPQTRPHHDSLFPKDVTVKTLSSSLSRRHVCLPPLPPFHIPIHTTTASSLKTSPINPCRHHFIIDMFPFLHPHPFAHIHPHHDSLFPKDFIPPTLRQPPP